jgi:PAS domain S-box-containing protein
MAYSWFLLGASSLILAIATYLGYFGYQNKLKAAQLAHQATVDELKSLFMRVPGAVMSLEKDFTIIDANGVLSQVTGLQPAAIKGKKCYDVLADGKICSGCRVQQVLKSGQPDYGTHIKYDKDGKRRYGKQAVIPVRDRAGNIEYVYEIVTDITHEISLEQENLANLMDIVPAMAHLIESRDPSTGTHCSNVRRIALAIGGIMRLSETEMNDLSIAAIIHDIGKIGIPESILNKPGRLTDLEFSIIQQHPQIGYDSIKHIKRLQNVSEAIRDHHEHYNGKGYPNRKSKEELSMIARVLAVADVFEALTSDRVYRPAMSVNQAISIIRDGKGQQFDPNVVDALLELVGAEQARQIS